MIKLPASVARSPGPTDEFRLRKTQKKKGATRYRGRIVKNERTREGHLAVLADHSTEDWRKNGRSVKRGS